MLINDHRVKDHTYFVYILASKSRVLYIGVTNSVQRRTTEHRGEVEGFCRQYRVWRLVHYERFQYVLNAIRRETVLSGAPIALLWMTRERDATASCAV